MYIHTLYDFLVVVVIIYVRAIDNEKFFYTFLLPNIPCHTYFLDNDRNNSLKQFGFARGFLVDYLKKCCGGGGGSRSGWLWLLCETRDAVSSDDDDGGWCRWT